MKYLFILITWMGNTAPYTQDIPIRDKVECERMEANLERAWKNRKKGNFVEIEIFDEQQAIKAAEKFKELQSKSNNIPSLILI